MTQESLYTPNDDLPVSTEELLAQIELAAKQLADGQNHMDERRKIALRYIIKENIIALGLDPQNYYGDYRALLQARPSSQIDDEN